MVNLRLDREPLGHKNSMQTQHSQHRMSGMNRRRLHCEAAVLLVVSVFLPPCFGSGNIHLCPHSDPINGEEGHRNKNREFQAASAESETELLCIPPQMLSDLMRISVFSAIISEVQHLWIFCSGRECKYCIYTAPLPLIPECFTTGEL